MYTPNIVQGHVRLTSFTQVSSKDEHDMFSPSIIFTTVSKYPDPPTLVMTAFLITSAFGSTSSSKSAVKKQGQKGRFRVAKLTCGGGNPASIWSTMPFLVMVVKPVCLSTEYYSSVCTFALTVRQFPSRNLRGIPGRVVVVIHRR